MPSYSRTLLYLYIYLFIHSISIFYEPLNYVTIVVTKMGVKMMPYIYCHPQTDCFVVSQHFSVARQARFTNL